MVMKENVGVSSGVNASRRWASAWKPVVSCDLPSMSVGNAAATWLVDTSDWERRSTALVLGESRRTLTTRRMLSKGNSRRSKTVAKE